MNYIVLDLEWNQGDGPQEVEGIPFEIIEIGAMKLDERFVETDRYSQLIRPQVYQKMHDITGNLLHLDMEQLAGGKYFAEAMEEFLSWCGKDEYLFCTWSSQDLTELQRNMKYYNLQPLSDRPIPFLDAQKLFAIYKGDRKRRCSLESAIDTLTLDKDAPFHRALSDAYYTAKIFAHMAKEKPELLENLSFDIFHAPKCREDEVKVRFDTYQKYISREFADKAEALSDREVISSKCYLCRRNLRKIIKWFSNNGKQYYCLAYCETHGYLKGKMRVKRSEDGGVYVVKTTRFVTDEEAQNLLKKGAQVVEHR